MIPDRVSPSIPVTLEGAAGIPARIKLLRDLSLETLGIMAHVFGGLSGKLILILLSSSHYDPRHHYSPLIQ
jgi:hypothetical protein